MPSAPCPAGDAEEGILCVDLRFAAQRGGADHGARGHVGEALVATGDEGVERDLARGDAGQRELGLHHHRHVLHRMHRDVGAAVEQRGLEFLDEQAFAADLGERTVEDLVATRGHAQQLDPAAGMERLEAGLDVFGLPQGETAFTGCDDDALGAALTHDRDSPGKRGHRCGGARRRDDASQHDRMLNASARLGAF